MLEFNDVNNQHNKLTILLSILANKINELAKTILHTHIIYLTASADVQISACYEKNEGEAVDHKMEL